MLPVVDGGRVPIPRGASERRRKGMPEIGAGRIKLGCDQAKLEELMSLLDEFDPKFPIVTSQERRHGKSSILGVQKGGRNSLMTDAHQ